MIDQKLKNKYAIYYTICVVLSVISAVFMRKWHYDEGWVLKTITHYYEVGTFRYVMILNDAEYTFVKPWFFLLSLCIGKTIEYNTYLLIRTPAAVLTILTWFLLIRILYLLKLNDPISLFCSYVIFTLATFDYLISARPDVTYTFISFMFFLFIIETNKVLMRIVSFLLYLLVPLVASSHPVGLFCLLELGAITLFFIMACSFNEVVNYIVLLILALVLTYFLVLWNLNISDFVLAYDVISKENGHSRGVNDEWIRYLDFKTQSFILFNFYMIAPIGFLIFLIQSRELKILTKFCIACFCICGLIFLLLFPSKWAYYLLIELPYVIVSLASLINLPFGFSTLSKITLLLTRLRTHKGLN